MFFCLIGAWFFRLGFRDNFEFALVHKHCPSPGRGLLLSLPKVTKSASWADGLGPIARGHSRPPLTNQMGLPVGKGH
jgi:hypothetical protein